ncbi:MAG: fused MFS/spermidine synthase [Nevskiales bacterium]
MTALCASGAASLIFEQLWFRLAGLSFGNTIWASTAVLSAFMAGLALGNALAAWGRLSLARPLLWYAGAELVIGLTGLALLWLLPQSGFLISPLLAIPGSQIGIAFLLMLLPSTAMGLTLPLLLRALYAHNRYGSLLGGIYGLNTLGAVVGVIAAEYWLIEWLGMRGAGLFAAALNLLAAGLALWLNRNWPASAETRSSKPVSFNIGNRWLVAAFISGAILLALEVVWFRLLLLQIRGTATSFATMLAIVLAGISLGGLLAAGFLRWRPNSASFASICAGLCALALLASYRLLPINPATPAWLSSLILMASTAIASGALFTALANRYAQAITEPSRATGRILVANTAGGMLGAALAGLLLVPQLGIEQSLLVLLIGYLACLFLVLPQFRVGSFLAACGSAVLLLLLFPWGLMQAQLEASSQPWRQLDNSRQVFQREGLNETLQLLQRDLHGKALAHRLVTNGESMSGTERDSLRYMKLFAWLPMALQPDINKALLISYGLGSTAEALLANPEIKQLRIVDISPEILQASRLTRTANEPLDDPRVSVSIEDGRHLLQRETQTYDLITGEPPPPRLAGIVNLYTQDYFALMHDRLSADGIASYWLPVDQLSLTSSQAILSAFCKVFSDCSLWAGSNYNWIMLGSREGLQPVSAEALQRLWLTPGLRSQLGALGFEDPAQLGASFLADSQQLAAWIGQAEPLTDNWPKRLAETGPSKATLKQYAQWLDNNDAAERFRQSEWLARIWPQSLRASSLNYYALQPILNNEVRADLNDRLRIIDGVLQNTALRIPVFWLLDSGIREQNIIDQRLEETGYLPHYAWHLGVRALAERQYGLAAQMFIDYLPEAPAQALPLAVYSLCRHGQLGEARTLAADYPNIRPGLSCW